MRLHFPITCLALLLAGCDTGGEPPAAEQTQAPISTAPVASATPTPTPTPTQAPAMATPVATQDSPPTASAASLSPRIPLFNATCGNGIAVHANEGGPVFIDGEETDLEKFNDNYFEASRDGTTISISLRPDGSLSLSFSGPNRANGICTLS